MNGHNGQGNLVSAVLTALEETLALDQATYGPIHPQVAEDLNKLGLVLQGLGRLNEARTNFERAFEIHQRVYGPGHPDIATDLNYIGAVAGALGDLPTARKHFEKALVIDEAAYGPGHPKIKTDLRRLQAVQRSLGEEPMRDSFLEASFGEEFDPSQSDHPNIEAALHGLGLTLGDLGPELLTLEPGPLEASIPPAHTAWTTELGTGSPLSPDGSFYWNYGPMADADTFGDVVPSPSRELDDTFSSPASFPPEMHGGGAEIAGWPETPEAESLLGPSWASGTAAELFGRAGAGWPVSPPAEEGRTDWSEPSRPVSSALPTPQRRAEPALTDDDWTPPALAPRRRRASDRVDEEQRDLESPSPPEWPRPEPAWSFDAEPSDSGAAGAHTDAPPPEETEAWSGDPLDELHSPSQAGDISPEEIEDIFFNSGGKDSRGLQTTAEVLTIGPEDTGLHVPTFGESDRSGREEELLSMDAEAVGLSPKPPVGADAGLSPSEPAAGADLFSQGRLLRDLGDLPGAKEMFQQALEADEAAHGPNHPSIGTDLSGLGSVLRELGELDEARDVLRRSIAINEGAMGLEDPALSPDLSELGEVLRDLGDLDGARLALQRAVAINEAAQGSEHPSLSTDLNTLAGILSAQGDLTGAKTALQRALAIDEAAYGKEHPKVATRLNNLGSVLKAQHDLFGAKGCLERALNITETSLGADDPKVAIRLGKLGSVLRELGDPFAARPHLERALAIDEISYGRDHPRVASRLTALGSVLLAIGDVAGAKAHLERALTITEETYGRDHPKFLERMELLNTVPGVQTSPVQKSDPEPPAPPGGPKGGIIRITSLIA